MRLWAGLRDATQRVRATSSSQSATDGPQEHSPGAAHVLAPDAPTTQSGTGPGRSTAGGWPSTHAPSARVKVRRVDVSALRVADLSSLESVRTRIKGSAYWVADSARRTYGGRDYLLIREPDNEVDASAVAVYGKGRKVGHLSAARAAALAPLLDALDADAFRVTGTGTSPNSMILWVDVPKTGPLRQYVRAHR